MVSIIVPVYNCIEYVEKCIKSIISQTYQDIEIIIVNDGSTDGSGKIIDSFIDERIIKLHQKNSGVCIARNNAIEKSKGEYITFVDGDDYIESDYIEKMISTANKYDSELVISGFIVEDTKGEKTKVISPKSYKKDEDEMWAYRLSAACGRLYKRSMWGKYNIKYTLQNGVRGEDVPICLLTNYIAKNVYIMDYAGYHYVQHKGSAMSQFRGLKKYGFPYEAMTDIARICNIVKEHNGKDFFDVGILKFFAQFYFDLGRGANSNVKRELFDFFCKYVRDNCPNYIDSWKSVKHKSKLPITIYIAIELLIIKIIHNRKIGS